MSQERESKVALARKYRRGKEKYGNPPGSPVVTFYFHFVFFKVFSNLAFVFIMFYHSMYFVSASLPWLHIF